MRKTKLAILFAALVALAVPSALAQDDGYGGLPIGDYPLGATKVIPAGTVVEPGSQLLFILDTGINANAELGDDANFKTKSVSELGGYTQPNFQNFISVTNTNPTDAVTVHFRFFNSDCKDVLDFLVVLTCNDTMMVDPLAFKIPGTAYMTSQRFFGAVSDAPVPAIPASEFGDGRFLLMVTTSGDDTDGDGVANLLFPKELVASPKTLKEDCDAIVTGTDSSTTPPTTTYPSVGKNAGIRDSNLHILNASAISFDFLVGQQTTAIPTEFLGGGLPAGANDLAYGNVAWTRPASDGSNTGPSGLSGYPAGVGIRVAKRAILSGYEDIDVDQFDGTSTASFSTPYYLRHEAAGGDWGVDDALVDHDNDDDTADVLRPATVVRATGALGWTLFPISGLNDGGALPDQQLVNMLSLLDDYNGSNNITGTVFQDHSYRLDPVVTFYNLTVYNNSEDVVEIPQPPVIISPPPPGVDQVTLVVAVRCLNAWTVGTKTNQVLANIGDFSVADLLAIGGTEIEAHLSNIVSENDEVGPGWVRAERLVSTLVYTDPAGKIVVIPYDGDEEASVVTIGQSVTRFEGFGASWWIPTVARTTPVSD